MSKTTKLKPLESVIQINVLQIIIQIIQSNLVQMSFE